MNTENLAFEDLIDVRDIIERVEALEETREDQAELDTLTAILEDLQGNGGDEQWRGDWYPVTLIRESYFTEYAADLVCSCYNMQELPHFVHIDWEATAREVKMDYSEVEIDGVTFFYR